MNFHRIGNSGLHITTLTYGSALTIGTESRDVDFAQEMIDTAWNLGIRSFDTSNNYGYGEAEVLLGEVLNKYPRQEYVVSTKGSWPVGEGPFFKGLSRKHILWAVKESLKRLNLEYIDIYYAHRYDENVSMLEVVRTFNSLIDRGYIRYWATSEWPVDAIEECKQICDDFGYEKPIADQFIYSYAIRKVEHNKVFDYCVKEKIGMLAFSPLSQGLLTGKYKDSIPEDSRIAKSEKIGYNKTINFYQQTKEQIDYFIRTCDKYQVEYVAAALQWVIRKGVFPVIGASKPEQLIHNVRSISIVIPEKFWEALEIGWRK